MEKHASRQEVATWLGISVTTVDRMVKRGDIPAIRLGPKGGKRRVIFNWAELKTWYESRRTSAPPNQEG
jgi:excisionase family DNA binding protein